jgi:YHS domain-containing protein
MGIETGDGLVEIISGLKPGEMVVTSGQFLIDSEAKVREALAKMIRGELASDQKAAAELAGTSAVSELPPAVASGLNKALNHYFTIGDQLAGDSVQNIGEDARRLAETLDQLVQTQVPQDPHFWHTHQDAIATARAGALKLIDTSDIAEARLHFAELSTALQSLIMATGVPLDFGREVQTLHCPMYRSGQGGTTWLQPAGDVRNPYFGSIMLECFDERKTMPVTGQPRQTDQAPAPTTQPQPDNPPAPSTDAAQAGTPNDSDTYPIDFCLVSGEKLGSMGAPVTFEYEGRTLKFCCAMCKGSFLEDPQAYLKKLDEAAQTLGRPDGGR